jgi:hypothetical protein
VTIILERNVFYFDGKFYRVGKWFKNSRSSLIKLGTSQHSGLSITDIHIYIYIYI